MISASRAPNPEARQPVTSDPANPFLDFVADSRALRERLAAGYQRREAELKLADDPGGVAVDAHAKRVGVPDLRQVRDFLEDAGDIGYSASRIRLSGVCSTGRSFSAIASRASKILARAVSTGQRMTAATAS
jgi:hypothetical protein